MDTIINNNGIRVDIKHLKQPYKFLGPFAADFIKLSYCRHFEKIINFDLKSGIINNPSLESLQIY